MHASIIGKVSEIILENRLGHKLPERIKAQANKTDEVQISSAGSQANRITKFLEKESDENRAKKVEALKTRVADRSYHMSDEVIDSIAENIAQIFI